MIKKIIFVIIILFMNLNLLASEIKIGAYSGFKLPRYVSLKSVDVNLRIGSSKNYPIVVKYQTLNLPIEIIGEYENWRKIKDIDKNVGWVHESLLKGDRFAIIKNHSLLFDFPDGNVRGEIGKKNIVEISYCLLRWCSIVARKKLLWIEKKNLWGVYKNEIFDNPFYQIFMNYYWQLRLLFK